MSADLYHRRILEAAKEAAGSGRLESPDLVIERDNPLCGDRIRLELALDGGTVRHLAHTTRGCLLTRAAASLLAKAAPGRPLVEIAALHDRIARWLAGEGDMPGEVPDLDIFEPARAVKSRHECVLLPFAAAREAARHAGAAARAGGASGEGA